MKIISFENEIELSNGNKMIYHGLLRENSQISTLGSVNPFFPSFTRTGFSVLVCQTSIWWKKTYGNTNNRNISKYVSLNALIQCSLPLSSASCSSNHSIMDIDPRHTPHRHRACVLFVGLGCASLRLMGYTSRSIANGLILNMHLKHWLL